jgi:hypothetical protein
MPIIIKCHSCGFVLYNGNELRSIDLVLREWGYRCPVCMSPLSPRPVEFKVVPRTEKHHYYSDDVIKKFIIEALREKITLSTVEVANNIAEKLGIETVENSFKYRVRDILYKLERDGVVERRGKIEKGKNGIIIWALKA